MFQALFGQIKGVFGKSYLLAGLIPAAILIIGLNLYRHGVAGVKSAVDTLLGPSDKLAFAGVQNAAFLLTTGLAFFALRPLVIETFQSMPWSILSPLRYWMLARQVQRSRMAKRRREAALYDLTVLSWHKRGNVLESYVPRWLKIDSQELVLRKSCQARSTLRDMTRVSDNGSAASRRTMGLIMDGYRSFYSLLAQRNSTNGDIDSLANELDEWRQLGKSESGSDALGVLEQQTTDHWLRARRKCALFPNYETWIEPTAFGNRLAALDDYAEKRYHIDTTTIWRRIWGILPTQDREEISDAKLSIEVMLNICVAFGLLGAAAAVSLMIETWKIILKDGFTHLALNWHAIRFITGTEIFAYLMYKLSVQIASALTENIVRAVDLYRLRVVVALGYPCPTQVKEELQLFEELQGFFTQGEPRDPNRSLKLAVVETAKEQQHKEGEEKSSEGTSSTEESEPSDDDDSSV
jgi:hypothetical protein